MSEQDNETITGIQTLHTNHYLTCSSGLAPAKMSSPQSVAKTSEGYYYLVSTGKATTSLGDFCCKWTIVLAAAIAAAGIVTGGAALVALAAVAVAASMAMCGGLAAPFRKWTNYNTKRSFGSIDAYSLTAASQMTCPIGGVITYAPGITGFWSAAAYTARNTTWAVFEGFMWGKLAGAGGSFVKAFGGTASASVKTALANFLTLQVSSRAMAVGDQVVFEGMLRNGKSLSESGDEAVSGLTIFEQPFVNFYQRVNNGYYTGSYAANTADTNGHGGGAMLTDLYYMGLSAMGMRAMIASAKTNPNIATGVMKQSIQKYNALTKGVLFERITLELRGLSSIYDNPVWRALWDQAKENIRNTGNENPLTRYESGMRGRIPGRSRNISYEREAFSYVEQEFRRLAAQNGTQVPSGQVHHNNWPIEKYSDNALDSKNLYPTEPTTPTTNQHRDIHRETSTGPHPYNTPVSPIHEKPLYEYKPRPIDDND
ncbi:hypothetical protein [Pedobacter alluvionis]|uniref:DUF4280 domain-containing protein n=1 Tax=Pedobacter alluvionis TaxID=475253 RepID=A0A497YAG1_9SPHI|nr:hypothetical protein [Pedobacter alluvionis]RLJ79467.1 hypothetical protein BCL90_0164 [Pedobacter alluvionis]TFB30815.1 hypothetical protein E3V97_09255 [Pedobacter alluvionis]